jgi:hypothetical protein
MTNLETEAAAEGRERELEDFAAMVRTYFGVQAELLVRKHRDYGPKNIALSPGGPINGLRVRMHDKMARINHLVDSGKNPDNESLRDSFMDMANYAVIALMVLDGEWPNG